MVETVFPDDAKTWQAVETLLKAQGIAKDRNLDYTCVVRDADGQPIATGSCFGNTIRCVAVENRLEGTGLLSEVMTHLIQWQAARGITALFLCTKCDVAEKMRQLGFYEVARHEPSIILMENQPGGFAKYLDAVDKHPECAVKAAVVMNANPFTKGHQFLLEYAAQRCGHLYVFIVSQDRSIVPFAARKHMLEAGTAHLKNISIHDCDSYMISDATFPSYFLKDEKEVVESHALLDAAVFSAIARETGITHRYLGEEPYSVVTEQYLHVLTHQLPKENIQCTVVPRREIEGQIVSASIVRKMLAQENWAEVRSFVPETTMHFFMSPQGAEIIRRMKSQFGNNEAYKDLRDTETGR